MLTRIPKRLFFAVLLLCAWLSFVIDGAHALFQTTASLTSNTISTGTVELLISNSQNASSTIYEPSRPGFPLEINPGQSMERFFLLKNSSPSDIPLSISTTALLQNNPGNLAQNITVEIVPVDDLGQPVGQSVSSTLQQLTNQPTGVMADIPKGAVQRFKMRLTMSSQVATQGDTVTYDLVFTGTQKI